MNLKAISRKMEMPVIMMNLSRKPTKNARRPGIFTNGYRNRAERKMATKKGFKPNEVTIRAKRPHR
nr:hypothetical protein [uncultured archaeon]